MPGSQSTLSISELLLRNRSTRSRLSLRSGRVSACGPGQFAAPKRGQQTAVALVPDQRYDRRRRCCMDWGQCNHWRSLCTGLLRPISRLLMQQMVARGYPRGGSPLLHLREYSTCDRAKLRVYVAALTPAMRRAAPDEPPPSWAPPRCSETAGRRLRRCAMRPYRRDRAGLILRSGG